jgi:HEAT repeats/PBS lyase HEAT-like repeat
MANETNRRRRAGLTALVVTTLAVSPGWAQAPRDAGVDSARGHSVQDRFRKARDGGSVEETGARLSDPDPKQRLAAVKSLAESGDPQATDFLVKSLDDTDPRVAAAAIDGLVVLRATDASQALSQRLFLKGVANAVRERILSALARIGDPAAAHSILDFARETPDEDLRRAALYAIGAIGDSSIQTDLRDLADRQTDPSSKRIAADALAKIANRSQAESGGTGGGRRLGPDAGIR